MAKTEISEQTEAWRGGLERGVAEERARCANIALAIDSGRGNEKEIAKAIMLGMPAPSLPR